MFTAEQRGQVRQRVLELARADHRVTAGALTGSMAFGGGDDWSDIDVAFGISEGITPEVVLDDWTQVFSQEWGVVDHFDLYSGPWVYRVFLLPSGLEVDVAVTPAGTFGARGPQFNLLFGTTQQLQPTEQPNASHLIGICWHHVFHARACIERQKPWQAEYWIRELRDHTLVLACLRLGENSFHGRGLDRLPAAVTTPLANALVHSLDELELRRALSAATSCLIGELKEWNPMLCARLLPLLREFGTAQAMPPSSPNALAEQ